MDSLKSRESLSGHSATVVTRREKLVVERGRDEQRELRAEFMQPGDLRGLRKTLVDDERDQHVKIG